MQRKCCRTEKGCRVPHAPDCFHADRPPAPKQPEPAGQTSDTYLYANGRTLTRANIQAHNDELRREGKATCDAYRIVSAFVPVPKLRHYLRAHKLMGTAPGEVLASAAAKRGKAVAS